MPPSPPRVVVADDDADMRLYVRACVEAMGADVVEAADGAEALRLAGLGGTSLVVCDLGMPVLNGAAVCRTLKDDARTAGIRVLIVSGETRDRVPPGADGFLLKPFNSSMLRSHVRDLLDADG